MRLKTSTTLLFSLALVSAHAADVQLPNAASSFKFVVLDYSGSGRITPQQEISYFVVGSGGTVRQGDIDRSSGLTASGFDTDLAFLAAEVAGDAMSFNVITRTGQTVDSGRVLRRK